MHLGSAVVCFLANFATAERMRDNAEFQTSIERQRSPSLTFSKTWSVLGPFQIGTREAAWGADPLEYHGGFPNLKPDAEQSFASALTPNGTVQWSTTNASAVQTSDLGSTVSISVDFSQVDWFFLRKIYGWSALQWQGWARGEIHVAADRPVCATLFTPQVLEYAFDGQRYFGGDFYGFSKAPHVLHLAPGKHVLDVRLVRDVRAMGGVAEPTIDLSLELRLCQAELEILEDSILVSDVLDGRLPSPYASVDIHNNGLEWMEVLDLQLNAAHSNDIAVSLLKYGRVAPGQTKPLVFTLLQPTGSRLSTSSVQLTAKVRGISKSPATQDMTFALQFTHKTITSGHKVTHLHPGSIVSYSILLPPSPNATCHGSSSGPIMLQLHGAGVETDSPMVYDVLSAFPPLCAWILFPSGVTPWSSDDWHAWGFADVIASIQGLQSWIEHTQWTGPGVDVEKWFVGGHSNGGQGAWYTLLHHPDKVFAATPLSGYLSISEYVPYKFWHATDPRKKAIIQAGLNSYSAQLLAANAKSIPVMQQHGGEDDNVPAYHSRLMHQLLIEGGAESEYHEVAGAGHWWDGVVTTDVLKEFYIVQITKALSNINVEVSDAFEIVVATPVETGSKFGLRIQYLQVMGELGRVVAARDGKSRRWKLRTENVLAFEWEDKYLESTIEIVIDGTFVETTTNTEKQRATIQFWQDSQGKWSTEKPKNQLRDMEYFGGLDAILRTNGAFVITYSNDEAFPTALQVSRNLHQYFYADSILQPIDRAGQPALEPLPSDSMFPNRISLSIGSDLSSQMCSTGFPIRICSTNVSLHLPNLAPKTFSFESEALGAIFLHPLPTGLGLMIWGSNVEMMQQAARLAPTMTGIGAPDWIILRKEMRWKGIDGASMGFFDARWEIPSLHA